MRQKVVVITDSLACLTRGLAEQYGVRVVPLSFMLQGKVYHDWVDLTPSQAYELFLQDPDSFQSSAPSPNDFAKAFRHAVANAPNLVCVTVSTKLSATFSAAEMAAREITAGIPGTKIEVIDSYTVTAAEGMVALAAAQLAAAGKDLPEVIKEAEKVRSKVVFLAVLNTIKHVYRSGRIPKVASQVGSLLHVKPILSVTPETGGKVHFNGIERSQSKGMHRIASIMQEHAQGNPLRVAVMHAYAPDLANKMTELVTAAVKCTDLWQTEFSPLMGYAVGTGTVGVAYYKED